MRCNQCGVENPEQVSFCQHCGNPLSAAAGTAGMGAKTSGTAIASFVMGLLCLTCVAWPFLFLPAIICGIIALVLIANNKGRLKGTGLAIAGIVIPVVMSVLVPIFSMLLAIMMPAMSQAIQDAERAECSKKLQSIGIAMSLYMDDNDSRFPTPERWCDLLVGKAGVSSFTCPAGECSYAMNKNLTTLKVTEDVVDLVVLFESNLGGWNGTGGPEDLVLRHTEGEKSGCNILFADGHVEFVTEDRFNELQWEPEQ